jgi:hypothetical protein
MFADAQAYVAANEGTGIGFALGKDVGVVVIDFDKVRATVNDEWPEWMLAEIEKLDSFTEISASNRGMHVICLGEIPCNLNRQGTKTEIWDSNKMFCFTGNVFEDRTTLRQCDLSDLHSRIETGKVGPNYRAPIFAEAYDSQKYRDITNCDYAKHGLGRSEAVQSALWTLARKTNFDADAMRREFEVTALCEDWGSKWERLGDKEINRAIQRVREQDVKNPAAALTFVKPVVHGGDYDFVIGPPEGKREGLFPRGDVSLVGGASGAGKTTLILPWLEAQRRKENVFGHETFGLPYILLLEDRGARSTRRTMDRLHLDINNVPHAMVERGKMLAQEIADVLDRHSPTPAVIFFEGLDLAMEDASKMGSVSGTIRSIQKVVQHYHVAFLGSVGAPKMKPKEKYENMRDRFFGSSAWGRKAETMIYLNEESDGTRTMMILPRHRANEKFRMRFNVQGRLEVAQVEQPTDELSLMSVWARQQTSFTKADFQAAFKHVTPDVIRRRLEYLREQGFITEHATGGRGAKIYRPIVIEAFN